MSVNLSMFAGAGQQFFDNSGNVLSGGKIYTYLAGTTTPYPTYTTVSGATPHANPIVLDSAGRVPQGQIWTNDSTSYKFVLTKSDGTVIQTLDNITGASSGILSQLSGSSGSSLIGFVQSGTGAVPSTVQEELRRIVNVKQFGALGDGVRYNDGIISGGSLNQLSSVTRPFTNSDVGSIILCQGIVPNYPSHFTPVTISSVSSGVATLSSSATSAYSNVVFFMGTDDSSAISAANTYAKSVGKSLYFPSGQYLLKTSGIPVGSNMSYFGEGPSSIIVGYFYNDGFETSNIASFTYYPVNSISVGDRGFTTTTAANASNFAPGDLVYLQSPGSAYGVSPNYGVPKFGQLCKVLSVNSSSGYVGIEGSLEEIYSGMRVCKAPSTIPQNTTIHNLSIIASVRPWQSNGSYKCTLRDLYLECTAPFSANLQTYFNFQDINCKLWYGGSGSSSNGNLIEFALNSYDSKVSNFTITQAYRDNATAVIDAIIVHENSRNCKIHDIIANVSGITYNTLLNTTAAIKIEIKNVDILAYGVNYSIVYFYNSLSQPVDASGITKMRSLVDTVNVTVGAGGYARGVSFVPDTSTTFDGVIINNLNVFGSASVSPGYSIFYSGDTIQNTRISNSVIDGTIQGLFAGNNNIIDNVIHTGPSQTGICTQSSLIIKNGQRKSNTSFIKNKNVGYLTTTTTTSGNVLNTFTISANSNLVPGDMVRVKATGTTYSGTPGASVAVVVNGSTYGTFAVTGPFTYSVDLVFLGGSGSYPYGVTNIAISSNGINGSSSTTAQFSVPGVTAANSQTISFAGWVTGAGATLEITKNSIEFIPLEQQ